MENKERNTAAKDKARRAAENVALPDQRATIKVSPAVLEQLKDVMHTLRLDTLKDAALLVLERGIQSMEEELNARKEEEAERVLRERDERRKRNGLL